MSPKKSGSKLDKYLADSQFNRNLYSKLRAVKRTYGVRERDFEVSFFHEFYAVLALVQENLDSPELFRDRIKQNEWVNLITEALIAHAEGDTRFQNSAAMAVIRAIQGDHEYDVQDEDYSVIWSSNTQRKLASYERRLALLPTFEARLSYLLRLETKVLTGFATEPDAEARERLSDVKHWLQLKIAEEKEVAELAHANPQDTDDEYDPAKRGLTRRKAMMLLDALAPNASNTAKAQLLFLLVGYQSEKARQYWSTYLLDTTLNKLAEDEKEVEEWKRKLKLE